MLFSCIIRTYLSLLLLFTLPLSFILYVCLLMNDVAYSHEWCHTWGLRTDISFSFYNIILNGLLSSYCKYLLIQILAALLADYSYKNLKLHLLSIHVPCRLSMNWPLQGHMRLWITIQYPTKSQYFLPCLYSHHLYCKSLCSTFLTLMDMQTNKQWIVRVFITRRWFWLSP